MSIQPQRERFMEQEIVQKHSIVIINPAELETRRGMETLVITGASRGGTSIVAYLYRRAGYYLGDKVGQKVHEDMEVHAAIEDGGLDALIARRNAAHARWGFKLPAAVRMMADLETRLRNPVFIVAYRNPLAIARSVVNKDPNFQPDRDGLLKGFEHGLGFLRAATEAWRDMQAPVVLVDADMAKSRPRVFVREVLGVLLEEPGEELVEGLAHDIHKPGYKAVLTP